MLLVLVTWHDSALGTEGWKSLGEIDAEGAVVRSVGWLLRDEPDWKVLVPHLIDPHNDATRIRRQGTGEITIPTRSIVKMTALDDSQETER